jgi:hypothetical protein
MGPAAGALSRIPLRIPVAGGDNAVSLAGNSGISLRSSLLLSNSIQSVVVALANAAPAVHTKG